MFKELGRSLGTNKPPSKRVYPTLYLRNPNGRSCFKLYFRCNYKHRKRKQLRQYAYNLFHKNRYKGAVRMVNRFCTALVEDPDFNPPNMDWVRDYTWRCMDNACNTLDWVAMQKVIKAEEARDIKERMVEKVARACVQKGLLKWEDKKDKYSPMNEFIGYTYPATRFLKEPRPWTLPGWKSAFDIRDEFFRWKARKKDGRERLPWNEEKVFPVAEFPSTKQLRKPKPTKEDWIARIDWTLVDNLDKRDTRQF